MHFWFRQYKNGTFAPKTTINLYGGVVPAGSLGESVYFLLLWLMKTFARHLDRRKNSLTIT